MERLGLLVLVLLLSAPALAAPPSEQSRAKPPSSTPAVTSVIGTGDMTCDPTTGDVICDVPMGRGTPVIGSACKDGASLYEPDHTVNPTALKIFVCDYPTLIWIGPFGILQGTK
jgi:hypothetical protein